MSQVIDRDVTIKLTPREDGGLRVCSDDLPGLILSHSDQRTVLKDLGHAIIALRVRTNITDPDTDPDDTDIVTRLLDEAQYSVSLSAVGRTKREAADNPSQAEVRVNAQSYQDYNQFRANLCTDAANEIKRLQSLLSAQKT